MIPLKYRKKLDGMQNLTGAGFKLDSHKKGMIWIENSKQELDIYRKMDKVKLSL